MSSEKENVEKRGCKISVRGCGGNASKGSKQYSVWLPSKWISAMGVTEADRDAEISFDGSVITIRKRKESDGEGNGAQK